MKQDELCYWLQGYFELASKILDPVPITAEQAECIDNHLELVKKCRAEQDPAVITGFCAWLDGAIAVAECITSPSSKKPHYSDITTARIQKKLGDEFLHVIDPKTPGVKEDLQATHDGSLQLPGGTSLSSIPSRL